MGNKKNQNQQGNGETKASFDTEFGITQSKKARKKAARERKNNS
ncbi:hypothetical protein [Aquibacillus halophilus]|nr:hypothetical protein [Aquibacillus halophilus]